MGSRTKPTPPDLDDVLDDLKAEIFAQLNCIATGRVESVNGSERTVSVQIVTKREREDGTISRLPLLLDCPLIVLQGGGAYVDMPVSVGDFAVVLFNDRDIDNWWKGAGESLPNTRRRHSLSDGFALVGANTRDGALDFDGDMVRIVPKSGTGDMAAAAREGDAIEISSTTAPDFFSWAGAVGTESGVGPPPDPIVGRISSGSGGVEIG